MEQPVLALAWTCAAAGVLMGGLGALVPGFPGSAVALLGVVAFAGLTDFVVVTPAALVVAALIAGAGAVAQLTAPVVASRAAGGAAGVATGAALGAALGALLPLPGLAWISAVGGAAVIGTIASREGIVRWLRGVVGAAGGCAVAVASDLVAVFGVAAVLAVADFMATVRM